MREGCLPPAGGGGCKQNALCLRVWVCVGYHAHVNPVMYRGTFINWPMPSCLYYCGDNHAVVD